jgi:hypothetical protein
MSCSSCASGNQTEFPVEMVIHLSGIKNVDHPGVLSFASVLICLDCGYSQYKVPAAELALLCGGSSKGEDSSDGAAAYVLNGPETASGRSDLSA